MHLWYCLDRYFSYIGIYVLWLQIAWEYSPAGGQTDCLPITSVKQLNECALDVMFGIGL